MAPDRFLARLVARPGVRFGLVLACAGVLAACGAKADEPASEKVDVTALRARNDSIRKARAAQPAPAAQTAQAAPVAETTAGATTPAKADAPLTNHAADSLAADRAAADTLGRPRETDVVRETFAYGGGTRDPFASLLKTKSTGPEFADLQLVGVYENLADASQSVAIVREKSSSKRHKLRTGDRLGRLRVTAIHSKDVVFTVQDFGYERQESLSLRKPQEDDTP